MIKRVCNICGSEVEHGFIYNGGWSHLSDTFKIKVWDSGIRKMDICSKCANKIRFLCQTEESEGEHDR